jgi:hypothetical protein
MNPKYEWLKIKDPSCIYLEGQLSWEEFVPDGWRIAFGDQMLSELNDILVKYDLVETYIIVQIKEKFGELRWYDNGITCDAWDEYCAWEQKYVDLSTVTCVICGEPAKMRTDLGWISPYCDNHHQKIKENRNERKG